MSAVDSSVEKLAEPSVEKSAESLVERALVHPEVERWLERANPFDVLVVHVRLKPLGVPGEEEAPRVVTPEVWKDPKGRMQALAAYHRVQKLRYGETLSRLRTQVTLDLRGPDDVPRHDYVVASGYRDAIRRIATLYGVAEIYPPPPTPSVP